MLGQVVSERIGEVLNGCRMAEVHHHSGAVMELPDSTMAFVHVSDTKQHHLLSLCKMFLGKF